MENKTYIITSAFWKMFSFALMLSIVMAGCTNLEEEVYSEVTEDSFVPAESDIIAVMASAYTPLRYIMGWQGWFDLQEESADIIVTPTRPNGWDDGGT